MAPSLKSIFCDVAATKKSAECHRLPVPPECRSCHTKATATPEANPEICWILPLKSKAGNLRKTTKNPENPQKLRDPDPT